MKGKWGQTIEGLFLLYFIFSYSVDTILHFESCGLTEDTLISTNPSILAVSIFFFSKKYVKAKVETSAKKTEKSGLPSFVLIQSFTTKCAC